MSSGLKSKVSGKISRVAKRADILGALIGYFGTWATLFPAEGVSYMEGLVARHVNAVQHHNLKGLSNFPSKLGDPNWNTVTVGGVAVGILGLITSYLPSIFPWQGALASVAKKAGFGAAIGGGLALLVGCVSEGSGGSRLEGSSSSGGGSISTTGKVPNPRGAFAPPTPYVGTWTRPR